MQATSNTAILVILLWLPFTALLFSRLGSYRAAAISLIAGVLIMPAAQDVILAPVIPHLERRTIVPATLLICALMSKKPLFREVRLSGWIKLCFWLIAITDVLQVLANREPLRYGPTLVPGTLPQNAVTFLMYDGLQIALMFYLGAAFGRDPERLKYLLVTWVTGALLYVPLSAIEVRLSPRVNIWVYGYLQHDITQMVRSGGFRPVVFMTHSLELALIFATSLIIAVALRRSKIRKFGLSMNMASGLLGIILVLCKSMAALSYGVIGFVLQRLSPMLRAFVAVVVACVVMGFPIARLNGWITAKNTAEMASGFGEERVSSLVFRMSNEDQLLKKIKQRPWTGWGGFARSHVYDEYGTDLSVTDGSWIIELGAGGALRFIGVFGVLTGPIFGMWRTVKRSMRSAPADAQLFSSLCLMAAFVTVDLLPNSFFNYLSFTVAGVLAGINDRMRRDPTEYWPTMAQS